MKRLARNMAVKRTAAAVPKSTVVLSKSRTVKASSDSKATKKEVVRGAEVSIRQNAAPGQIIYGKFRVGGFYTFFDDTKNSSAAYLRTGEDNSQIVWIARAVGSEGNDISVTLVVSGTVGTTTVAVTGKAIVVTCKSVSSSSRARANEVISAIQATPAADALVSVHKGEGNGTSYVQPVEETFLSNGGAKILHQIITLAAHEITAVDQVYLDGRLVSFGYNQDARWSIGYFLRTEKDGKKTPLVFMTKNLGTEDQEALSDLTAVLPTRWTANHRQRGNAHVYLRLIWDAKRFAQGLPDTNFTVRGKPVYDTRTATTAYSTNAALIIADYLTNTKFGLGVSWDDVDTASVSAAADICDELVTLADTTTEARYRISGVFDTSQSPQSILEQMAEAIAGDIVFQGGKWRIVPGKWRAPEMSLWRSDLLSAVTVQTRKSRAETFNCVKGTFTSENHGNDEHEFPVIKVPAYIAEDGREIYADLALNFVISSTQAQRIAKIRLGQVRQTITIDGVFSLKALALQIGDTVEYTDAQFGWTSKVFEVRDFSLQFEGNSGYGVRLTLVETAEAIYTWTSAEQLALDPAPNSDFPSYDTIDAPTGLIAESGTDQLYLREDGTVFSRLKLTWAESASQWVQQGGSYELQIKPSSSATWAPAGIVGAEQTSFYFLDVQDGASYDVRVRGISSVGTLSDWATLSSHLVVGKTAVPSNVVGLGAVTDETGIRLAWQPVADLDVREYDLRYGGVGASWESISATSVKVRTTNFLFQKFTAGNYRFQVRAVDTSGNVSAASATTDLLVTAPPVVQNLLISQVDNNVLVDWDTPTASTFPVEHYRIYRGASFAGANLLGRVQGTFFTYIEQLGGEFTYWVVPVDYAGNVGAEAGQAITVYNPPDYILLDNRALTGATAVRSGVDLLPDGTLLAPVNLTETFAQHFTNNSNNTVQDFIDDGFTIWAEPSTTTPVTAVWEYDIGTVIPNSLIALIFSHDTPD